jgi:hypothetical protein
MHTSIHTITLFMQTLNLMNIEVHHHGVSDIKVFHLHLNKYYVSIDLMICNKHTPPPQLRSDVTNSYYFGISICDISMPGLS